MAPAAFGATNITVVAGSGTVNNSGPPSFTPTGANSQVGAGLIVTQLNAGTDVTLDTSAADFSQGGSITINGAISASGSGDLILDADDPITQSAPVTVGDISVRTNTSDDVVLTDAANDFGTVTAPLVSSLQLTDADDIVVAGVTANSSSMVTAGGALTQTGSVQVVGGLTMDVGSTNDITLDNASNQVSGVTILSAHNASFRNSAGIVLGTNTLPCTISGNLSLTATTGQISQLLATTVAGITTLTAPSVTLNNAANDWSTVVLSTTGNASVRDADDMVLGASSAGGNLTLTAGAALTQSGAAAVTGTTTATGAPVVLDNAANALGGAVALSSSGGGAAAVVDADDLTLDSSSSGGALTATAGDDLTVPAARTIAASGPLRLVSDNANPTSPAIGTGGIALGANDVLTGSGAIRLYAANRADNSIDPTATMNGATFTPGTYRVASATEQYGVYSPDGTATAPFTFFYKEPPLPPAEEPAQPPPTQQPAPTPPATTPPASEPARSGESTPPAPVGRITARRPRLTSGATVSLPFSVSGAGTLEVLVMHGRAGRLAARSIELPPGYIALARARVTTTGAGTVTVPFRLSRRTRAILRRNRHRLGVVVIAVFTPTGGAPRSIAHVYTFRQARRNGRVTLRLTGLRPATG